MVLERNPTFREWSADAQPDGFADRIEVVTGIDPSEQVRMVERGEADFAFGGVPFDLVEELDRRASDQLVRSPWPSIFALSLNTATYPFSNADARRAVAYALEREELVRAVVRDRQRYRRRRCNGRRARGERARSSRRAPRGMPRTVPTRDRARRWTGHGQGRIPHGHASWSSALGQRVRRSTIGMSPCLAVDCCVGQGHAPKAWDIAWTWRPPGRLPRKRIAPSSPFRLTRTSPPQGWLWDYPSRCAVPGAPPLVRAAERVAPLRGRARRDGVPRTIAYNFSYFCDPKIDRRMQPGVWSSNRPTRMRRLARSKRSTTTSSIAQH